MQSLEMRLLEFNTQWSSRLDGLVQFSRERERRLVERKQKMEIGFSGWRGTPPVKTHVTSSRDTRNRAETQETEPRLKK